MNGVVITNRPTRKTDAYARRVVNDAVSIASVVTYAAIASAGGEEPRDVEPVRLQILHRRRVAPAERPRNRMICGSHAATIITVRNAAQRETT